MKVRFAKYAMRELGIYAGAAGALFVLVLVLGLLFLPRVPLALLVALPFAVLFIVVVRFFRDPERVPPKGEHRLVAPADGAIYDIGDVREPDFLDEEVSRVGIFLSVFDCHINRAPCSGTVEKIVYKKGAFHNAWTQANRCSGENESNLVCLSNGAGRGVRVGVKQIAGAIARRIVCELKEGDAVARGQTFGMIKFGSRTELFIPKTANFRLRVKLGAHVKAGVTVIGTFEEPKKANAAGDRAEEPHEDDGAILEELVDPAAEPGTERNGSGI